MRIGTLGGFASDVTIASCASQGPDAIYQKMSQVMSSQNLPLSQVQDSLTTLHALVTPTPSDATPAMADAINKCRSNICEVAKRFNVSVTGCTPQMVSWEGTSTGSKIPMPLIVGGGLVLLLLLMSSGKG